MTDDFKNLNERLDQLEKKIDLLLSKQITYPVYPPYPTQSRGCTVCGIEGINGYVCNRMNCPVRITCM